ncbi:MAG: PH domain-containing protein, partial [Actinomycetes bacterium]
MFGPLSRVIDPRVEQYLLVDEDEYIVDEVQKHPMAVAWPVLRLLAALVVFVSALFVDPRVAWVMLLVSVVVGSQALWRILEAHMDRFV